MTIQIKKRSIELNPEKKPLELNRPKPLADNKKFIPDPYKKIAAGMERQFVEHMITEMNKTAQGDESQGTGMNYYKSLLNSERSDAITKNRGGLGVQDVILDQIYPKKMRSPQNYQAYLNQAKNIYQKQNIDLHSPEKNTNNIGIHKGAEVIHE